MDGRNLNITHGSWEEIDEKGSSTTQYAYHHKAWYAKAQLSLNKAYRYSLIRYWGPDFYPASIHEQKLIVFIGLNPSTANEVQDDPTIRRCIGFARSWGYDGLCMLNLFAFRTTDPKEILKIKDIDKAMGIDNLFHIGFWKQHTDKVIACWGTNGKHLSVDKYVIDFVPNLSHLGLTKNGHPRHPLYLKKDTKPVKWEK